MSSSATARYGNINACQHNISQPVTLYEIKQPVNSSGNVADNASCKCSIYIVDCMKLLAPVYVDSQPKLSPQSCLQPLTM